MDKLNEGSVVICDSGQIGCIVQLDGQQAFVLLKNMGIWHGIVNRLREPQDQADIDACPLEIERKVKFDKVDRD